jgi:hypothetical protein
VPVRVSCPHCRTPCLVAEQHQGVPLKCGRCGRTFTMRADPKATMRIEAPVLRVRLDLGAAASSRQGNEDSYLVQRLVCCNLEERHELAVLMVANGSQVISAAAAALAPLLDKLLSGGGKEAADTAETLAGACKTLCSAAAIAVIHDGRVALSGVGKCPVYHYSGGRLNRLKGDPLYLAAGDWLFLACKGQPAAFDAATLQAEIAAAHSSAVDLAQRLVQRAGEDTCTVVVARGV